MTPRSSADATNRLPRVAGGPFDWPLADEDIRAALDAAYRDGSWGRYSGPHGDALVEDLRAFFACKQALLCSSGTIGVELALRGCGVEAGDEVILAGYDFPGNFRAVEAIGARPVLVDIDPGTWCLDTQSLEEAARINGDRVTAVVVSHLHGGLADMPKIVSVARRRGWAVVEDACQQPGAQLEDRLAGRWGDVGVLSFGGSKLLTAGRGGTVLTDDARIHQRMKVYAQRGNQAFPLSELQAAVLRPQLAKLPRRNQLRAQRVETLREATAQLSAWLRPVVCPLDWQPAYYKLAWSFAPAESQPELRDALIVALHAAGAPIDEGFRGFTGRSAHRCRRAGKLDASARLSRSTILLHHPILLAPEQAAWQVARVLDDAVRRLAT